MRPWQKKGVGNTEPPAKTTKIRLHEKNDGCPGRKKKVGTARTKRKVKRHTNPSMECVRAKRPHPGGAGGKVETADKGGEQAPQPPTQKRSAMKGGMEEKKEVWEGGERVGRSKKKGRRGGKEASIFGCPWVLEKKKNGEKNCVHKGGWETRGQGKISQHKKRKEKGDVRKPGS